MKPSYCQLIFLVFLAFNSHAQKNNGWCGTITNRSWETAAFDKIRYAEGALKTTTTYYIPVVFHIVHEGGYENVGDTFVYRLLNELNNKFANTAPYHATDGVDVGIHFCLAQTDTAGDTTSGITRDSAAISNMYMYMLTLGLPLTYDVDSVLKKGRAWDTRHYLNIYIVKNAYSGGGLAGYAYYPSSYGTYRDGIVLDVDYVNPADTFYHRYDVIAHETGHYLGLYHTFEAGCTNTNCMTDNDGVCDTPPDNYPDITDTVCVRNSCTTDVNDTSVNNPFRSIARGGLGDQNDDARNLMDYSLCSVKFTPGQRTRMIAALITTRHSLLDSVNSICGLSPGATQTPVTVIGAIAVTPNPFTDEVTIVAPQADNYVFTVIDLMGRAVYGTGFNGTSAKIHLDNLPPAPYSYILIGDRGILKTGRIIKN